ncbi:MAG: histidine kinase [Treponema sp.]|nr:histidine kinase [Treponema sp.]
MIALSGMILIIMSILVKTSYSDSLKKNEINAQVRATIRSKYQFDYIMSVIDSTAREISASAQITGALRNAEMTDQSEIGDFSVNTFLQSMRTIQPFLGDITIVGTQGQFFSSNLAIKKTAMLAHFGKYVESFQGGSGADFFVDIQSSLISPNAYNNLLTGVWPIFETRSQELWGAIFVGLSYSVFQELFILSPLTNDEKFLMVNKPGEIVYTYPAYESFDHVLTEYPGILNNADITIEGKLWGKDCIIVSEISAVLGWKFIRIIDAKNVTTDTRKMQMYFNIALLVSIVISILYGFYVSNTLAKKELAEQKRENELRLEVLQAQINPHFLYNTLDSIKFLATLQEVHNIASMCQDLIRLLKYNLSVQNTARLCEEVESIQNYAGIQKYRYGDIFELKTEIGAGTEQCVIPRFVLQPLVENAIIHGFDDMESGGEITVRSFFYDSKICLEVIDNGSGMDEGVTKSLNVAEETAALNGNGASPGGVRVGIANIRERLRIQFNGRAALVFESTSGQGSRARLIFPMET